MYTATGAVGCSVGTVRGSQSSAIFPIRVISVPERRGRVDDTGNNCRPGDRDHRQPDRPSARDRTSSHPRLALPPARTGPATPSSWSARTRASRSRCVDPPALQVRDRAPAYAGRVAGKGDSHATPQPNAAGGRRRRRRPAGSNRPVRAGAGLDLPQWDDPHLGAVMAPPTHQLIRPYGAAVNGGGHVFVADSDNERIQEFSGTGGTRRHLRCHLTIGDFQQLRRVALNRKRPVYGADLWGLHIDRFSAPRPTPAPTYGHKSGLPTGVVQRAVRHQLRQQRQSVRGRQRQPAHAGAGPARTAPPGRTSATSAPAAGAPRPERLQLAAGYQLRARHRR